MNQDEYIISLKELLYSFDRENKLPETAHVKLTLDNSLTGPTLKQLYKLEDLIDEVLLR
jgi:hypothetical protein